MLELMPGHPYNTDAAVVVSADEADIGVCASRRSISSVGAAVTAAAAATSEEDEALYKLSYVGTSDSATGDDIKT